MTSKASGGLLSAGRLGNVVGNDKRRAPTALPPADKQDAEDKGWDPFEVWRTRIKEVRERNSNLIPDDRRKN
ncbi:MAG TPA: hypothetical protein VE046_03090 [Steroidobacteraceae bacterium]|nr:hypothetical protein [Steroidobacteraceae bacterium]